MVIAEPYLLVMEYVMYGKLLTHLREHRIKQSSFFNFSGNKDGVEVGEALTSKDLTKFAYGVAKGMEYLVSKGVSFEYMPKIADGGWLERHERYKILLYIC